MDSISTECLVVGGGVIGVAIAREISKNNVDTILVEMNDTLGAEVSSRNSGVIHAGFYYPKDSLKAKFCNAGNKLLYDFCEAKNVVTKKTGKILVASSSDALSSFKIFQENAIASGGDPLRIVYRDELLNMEPELSSNYGLHSPETGIIDVHGFISALAQDFLSSNNGLVSLHTQLLSCRRLNNAFVSILRTGSEEFEVRSKQVILAAGLHSFAISKLTPLNDHALVEPVNYSKGHYFKLSGKSPFKHLIYPMPTQFGLGIHSSPDIDGSLRFGPDASWVTDLDYAFTPGVKSAFVSSILDYWPALDESKLHEDYVGIRPKIQKPNEAFKDFSILTKLDHKIDNLIFLQGIESPGITSSLPIARHVVNSIQN